MKPLAERCGLVVVSLLWMSLLILAAVMGMRSVKNMEHNKPVSDHTETREATTVPVTATHTPGPWQSSIPGRDDAHMCVVTTAWQKDGCFLGLAQTWSHQYPVSYVGLSRQECIANARLIAAAPDLLAALKELHDNLAEYIALNRLGGYDNHDMQMARAAIAKAEGR